MKRTFVPAVILGALAASAIAASSADPTVMTVNGKSVPLSEFEYLYNKNNSQQSERQSVDEYADLFLVYKLKVADAEAAGIDTTQAFLSEFNKYRDELAKPYMTDASVEDSLVNEIYDHMRVNRDVNYIMMYGGRTAAERAETRSRLDSIRTAIVTGKGDFAELADRFSVDKNQGHMGYMTANRYPYAFEKAVYNTPIGQVSEIQEFPYGFFIVRIDGERPDPGRIHARHILKMTRGVSPEVKAQKRQQIDSIAALLAAGADFEELARTNSDDPGSAAKGGDLGFFGMGQMVKPFEDAAFALADGQTSGVVESPFGFHIIQRLESQGIAPLAEVEKGIRDNIAHDERAGFAADKKLREYKALYGAKTDAKVLKAVNKEIKKAGGIPASLGSNNKVVASVGDTRITVAEVASNMHLANDSTAASVEKAFAATLDNMLDNATRDYALKQLPDRYPDYKNLINEYRDGMLLFEVSNNKVWDLAQKDTEGLEAFYRAHRADYAWDKPRFKGFVVFATGDSIGNAARDFLATCSAADADLAKIMRDRYGKDVRIQQVLAAKGDNEIIDHIAFGGPEPSKPNKQWPVCFSYRGRIIPQPEGAADVRGAVTADYQAQLEKEWVDYLRNTYPYTINTKVLETVK